jgi:hypothetical protein
VVPPQLAVSEDPKAPIDAVAHVLPVDGGTGFRLAFYGQAEYLLWWTRGSQLPPLVTTTVDPKQPGGLAGPGTPVLIGGQTVSGDIRSGGRFLMGTWLLEDHLLGVEVQGLFLENTNQQYQADLTLLTPPNVGAQSVTANSSFWGLAADVRTSLSYTPSYHFDALLGYRTLALNENLNLSEEAVTSLVPFGTRVGGDRFATNNQFHGVRLGAEAGYTDKGWSVDLRGSLAVGYNVQSVDISGLTVTSLPTTVYPTGMLAASSNSGNHNHSSLGVVPEVGLRVGYQLTERLRAYAGYDLVYWTNVLRPGDQIDRAISQGRPTVPFTSSDFWAQGVVFGQELRY